MKQTKMQREEMIDSGIFPVYRTTLCCECAEDLDRYAERIAELRAEVNRLKTKLETDRERAIRIIRNLRSKRGRTKAAPAVGPASYLSVRIPIAERG